MISDTLSDEAKGEEHHVTTAREHRHRILKMVFITLLVLIGVAFTTLTGILASFRLGEFPTQTIHTGILLNAEDNAIVSKMVDGTPYKVATVAYPTNTRIMQVNVIGGAVSLKDPLQRDPLFLTDVRFEHDTEEDEGKDETEAN